MYYMVALLTTTRWLEIIVPPGFVLKIAHMTHYGSYNSVYIIKIPSFIFWSLWFAVSHLLQLRVGGWLTLPGGLSTICFAAQQRYGRPWRHATMSPSQNKQAMCYFATLGNETAVKTWKLFYRLKTIQVHGHPIALQPWRWRTWMETTLFQEQSSWKMGQRFGRIFRQGLSQCVPNVMDLSQMS